MDIKTGKIWVLVSEAVVILISALMLSAETGVSHSQKEIVSDPLAIARAVADRELFGKIIASDSERPRFKVHHSLYWTDATLMSGVTELFDRTEQIGAPIPRDLDYIQAWASRNPGGYPVPIFHGDMVGAGQTYIWVYERSGKKSNHLERTNGMIDLIFKGRKFSQIGTGYHDYWMLFWIDDTYMIPTFLAERGRAAGSKDIPNGKDGRAIAMEYLRAYDDILYNAEAGLYWHDRKNIGKFNWSRGDGWAAASFYKVMKVMEQDPAYQKDAQWLRARLVRMSQALKENRNVVGTWNADILNRKIYSAPETSGAAFFVYMMANMINDGYLPDEYMPVVQKAWHFLSLSVTDQGRLMRVQPVGDMPVEIDFETNSESFGVGGFLLAATAMSRLPEPVLARADQVECIKLSAHDFAIKNGEAEIKMEKLRALRPEFPASASGTVQAVFPGKVLPKTFSDEYKKIIVVKDFPVNYRGSVYLFYSPGNGD